MDNILGMMEKYAYNLEEIVEERTQQLAEEKKKTDRLLYRMLPSWAHHSQLNVAVDHIYLRDQTNSFLLLPLYENDYSRNLPVFRIQSPNKQLCTWLWYTA